MSLVQPYSEETCQQCSTLLHNGGVIAYPTEGVFGIGCNPLDENAVERIVNIKQRDAAKGLILVAATRDQLEPYLQPFTPVEEQRVDSTWPGPVTWVVRSRESVPDLLTGGRPTLAVRVSDHPVVNAICKAFDGAVISTSANFSGQPPCTNAKETANHLGELLDLIVDAPVGGLAGATEIRNIADGKRLR